MLEFTDARVARVNQMLQGMRFLKVRTHLLMFLPHSSTTGKTISVS